jgi:lipoyl(octanoyl) transferase
MILRVLDAGCVAYGEARAMQESLAALRGTGDIPDTLMLVEHPPTITLGRGADLSHLLLEPAALRARGIEVVETDRGGDVTYHGPGQLVGYPIMDLKAPPHSPDLHRYLRQLEELLIRALAEFEVPAGRFPGYTGVWTRDDNRPAKIAAIGVRVSRWITQHGFALNVCTDMRDFETIVPCGIRDHGVTSMSNRLGRPLAVDEVKPAVARCAAAVFGHATVE